MHTFQEGEGKLSGGIIQEEVLKVELETESEGQTSLEVFIDELSEITFNFIDSLQKGIFFIFMGLLQIDGNKYVLVVIAEFKLHHLSEEKISFIIFFAEPVQEGVNSLLKTVLAILGIGTLGNLESEDNGEIVVGLDISLQILENLLSFLADQQFKIEPSLWLDVSNSDSSLKILDFSAGSFPTDDIRDTISDKLGSSGNIASLQHKSDKLLHLVLLTVAPPSGELVKGDSVVLIGVDVSEDLVDLFVRDFFAELLGEIFDLVSFDGSGLIGIEFDKDLLNFIFHRLIDGNIALFHWKE
mmetsp:Transcript_31320/g.28501  ORF Transcript_31320/g.28501 Transcript_31320/m.28501 type:complete len:299 (+) Transcript_31320:644-1540(+)